MIFIVTPVFNRKEFTRNYLRALSEQTVKDFKVIIVDDGSTDGTSEMIKKEFTSVILLQEEGDLWWAEATNIGVKYALAQGATYVMTLNDDTVPTSDYIEKMLFAIEEKPNALLGAFAVGADTGKPIFGGEKLHWNTCSFENILTNVSDNDLHGFHEVNIFPGRGLLIPVNVFNDIGFYDSKNFPQTVADLDFTARAFNAGYKIYCNYDAKIKIYPEESGGVGIRKNKSWKNYYLHLFGMRGAGNLKWFTIFSLKNTPKKYLIQCLGIGISRRVVGYLRDWVKEKFNGKI